MSKWLRAWALRLRSVKTPKTHAQTVAEETAAVRQRIARRLSDGSEASRKLARALLDNAPDKRRLG